MVDNEALSVDLAVTAQDAATVDSVFQPERAIELIEVLRESEDELRKRILEVNKSNPTSDVERVVATAKKPDERLKVGFTMGAAAANALRVYADGQGANPDTVAQELVESSLKDLGAFDE